MSYYRVPCQLRLRAKALNEAELEAFKDYLLKPEGLSQVRNDIEHQIQVSDLSTPERQLTQNAFSILLALHHRIERIEGYLEKILKHDDSKIQFYETYSVELGAEGMAIKDPGKTLPADALLEFDMVIMTIPEQRIRCLVKRAAPEDSAENDQSLGEFLFEKIHPDDREYIYRYIRQREREILRARQVET